MAGAQKSMILDLKNGWQLSLNTYINTLTGSHRFFYNPAALIVHARVADV